VGYWNESMPSNRQRHGGMSPALPSGVVVLALLGSYALCLAPWSVPPRAPIASVNGEEGRRRLESVARLAARHESTAQEQALMESLAGHSQLQLGRAADDRFDEIAAAEQFRLARLCNAVGSAGGAEALETTASTLGLRLVKAIGRIEKHGAEAESDARSIGGSFLDRAKQTGIVGADGRFETHPLVPFVLARAGYLADCGLPHEAGLTPIELDAFDVFRIHHGRTLPRGVRYRAIERFGQRHPSFPASLAAATIALEAGDHGTAHQHLRSAFALAPRSLALQNHLRFVDEIAR